MQRPNKMSDELHSDGSGVSVLQIDLNMYPERRREMLLHNDGIISLPQLRVNGVYVGDGNTVQELEDFGELDEVLEVSSTVSTLLLSHRLTFWSLPAALTSL